MKEWILGYIFLKRDDSLVKRQKFYNFWNDFYIYAKNQVGNQTYWEKSTNKQYKEGVIFILDQLRKVHRGEGNCMVADPKELCDLQVRIENLTMQFDEKSIFSSTSDILKIMINLEKESVKVFLHLRLNRVGLVFGGFIWSIYGRGIDISCGLCAIFLGEC